MKGIWHVILPILVGGIIGYCTNYIAIKMLFRPHHAVMIGRHQLPFTPGIISKNQKRVARAVGDAVSDQLLTKDALLSNLGEAGNQAISKIASEICGTSRSILDLLPKDTDSDQILNSLSAALSETLIEKAESLDLNALAERVGTEAVNSALSTVPMLSLILNAGLQKKLFDRLAAEARNYINVHGKETVQGFLSSYLKDLAGKPLNELIPSLENREKIQSVLENTVRGVIENHGADFLEQVDIRGIIADRIEAMEMDELEELVMSVMKQELQAVINLGAVIGCVIGVINVFL